MIIDYIRKIRNKQTLSFKTTEEQHEGRSGVKAFVFLVSLRAIGTIYLVFMERRGRLRYVDI